MLRRKYPSWTDSSVWRRRAFTLVELLVVVGLILLVTAMGLYFVPSINNEQRATQAGTQLQQWIEITKQRAARDRAPRGIRLLPGTANNYQVTQLVYTEQPPDFWLGAGSTFSTGFSPAPPNGSGLPVVNFVGGTTTLTGGRGMPKNFLPNVPPPKGTKDPNAGRYPVQPGDRIALGGSEEIHSILAVSDTLQLTLVPPPPAGVGYATSTFINATQYRIIRQPRSIGDDPLQMPANIIIDCATRNVAGNVYDLQPYMQTQGYIDIMFSPDGRVIGQLAGLDKIILWVRDVTVFGGPGESPVQGDPALVCVYPRTGLVAAYPVDTFNSNTNPYLNTTTGRRSSQ